MTEQESLLRSPNWQNLYNSKKTSVLQSETAADLPEVHDEKTFTLILQSGRKIRQAALDPTEEPPIWITENGDLYDSTAVLAWCLTGFEQVPNPSQSGNRSRNSDELRGQTREFHELICMGLPNYDAIATAMRVEPSRVRHLKLDSKKKHPVLNIEFHNFKIETAIDLRMEGYSWGAIANMLGYSFHSAAYQSVKGYLSTQEFNELPRDHRDESEFKLPGRQKKSKKPE